MDSPPQVKKPKKNKKKDDKDKKKRQEYDGLCATCNNAPTCTHRINARAPVLQCEEFDGYQAATPKTESVPVPKKGNGNDKEGRQFKGLCVNCDHRETCPHADLEGGVWHCEEYS